MLAAVGLLPAARLFRRLILALIKSEYRRQEGQEIKWQIRRRRRERAFRERFLQFGRQYGDVLRQNLTSATSKQKRVLIVGANFPEVEIELGLIKALELAGFTPVAIVSREANFDYYKLVAVREVYLLSEFLDPPDLLAARAIIEQCRSIHELLTFEYAGARVGKFAVSTALQRLRVGSLDLLSTRDLRILVECVASGIASAAAAEKIVQKVHPQLALFHDRVYTPQGEIFDHCWTNGIDAVRWHPAHKSSTLMLKRYTLENRDEHPVSLSSQSWKFVQEMEWTQARRAQLQRELYSAYASGDWYSEGGTQFKKRFVGVDEIRKQLGLDSVKKTACIFPHIPWDASFSWGTSLFHGYEEWFIATVRAACKNDRVNWVIKIHPAHVGKSAQVGYSWEPAEVTALHKYIGELPPHVFMIPAESDMSTLSLFDVMDYCVTVSGTVGIEAASLGIPVLTAATGRYSHKGFTIDSESREQYLGTIARIQDIPRLSTSQRALAERFAYGLFVMRPLPLKTVAFQYPDHEAASEVFIRAKTQINIRTTEDWYQASDLKAFAHWVNDSRQPDFLMPLSEE